MDSFLNDPITVPLKNLFPDPNNPRLAILNPPGYEDAERLFDTNVRAEITSELTRDDHLVKELVETIAGQGWMPIDNILVWRHPDDPENYVVAEGNRRRIALDMLRNNNLPKERKRLEIMEARRDGAIQAELADQRQKVEMLEDIVAETDVLRVIPIDADSAKELIEKLPRVLAVRHISRAKDWGGYAEDIWLLSRFKQLFGYKYGESKTLFWDQPLINKVASEASLTPTLLKRQVKSASWWRHFIDQWEVDLPNDEEFKDSDYYLFQLISRSPWLRRQLNIGEDDLHLPHESEMALFEWFFKLPRPGRSSDHNPNKFASHQDITKWSRMNDYDQKNHTDFALKFDVDNPEEAPILREVEADWLNHRARKHPQDILDQLLKHMSDFKAEQLVAQGDSFKIKLEEVQNQTIKFIKMIEAAGS